MEAASLFIIKMSRRYFRNTWVHRMPLTNWVYRRVFVTVQAAPEKIVRFRGMRLVVPTRDISMVPSIVNGDYETVELGIFEKLIKPGMTVLDVGANLGIYTITASKLVGPKGKVYAFEPVPENIEHLSANIALNGASDNVTLVPKAVGGKVGKAEIGIAPQNTGTHAIGAAEEYGQSVTVEVTTLDEFMKGKKVDVAKIDVEGYEGYVLEGAKKTLKGTTMIMEFQAEMLKRAGSDPKKVGEDLLKMFKYCYVIDERHGSLSKAKKSDFVNLNFVNLVLSDNPVKM